MTTAIANLEFREAIKKIEELLLQLPQIECPVAHTFDRGVYTRQFFMPAGILGTGRIHTYSCINILMSGTMTVWSETQGKLEITAPFMWTSPGGTKRMFAAATDVCWVTIHRTDKMTIESAEAELFSTTYEEYEAKARILKGD